MKILMLIDYLDVGGAETHVEQLSLELASMGHNITVGSAGGAVFEKLKKKGISCVRLPRISSETPGGEYLFPLHLLRTGGMVRELIYRGNFDVVHAHTRRMSFLASRICRSYKIPLVVTAHAKFSMKFPKNLLSGWGDKTVAVSEDIKNHLLKQGVKPNRIFVVENGVKLPKEPIFSMDLSKRGVKNAKNSICQPS